MIKFISYMIVLFSLSGCINQPSPSSTKMDTSSSNCIIDNEQAPVWLCGGESHPEYFTSIGISESYSPTGRKKTNSIVHAIENLFSNIKKDVGIRSTEYFLRLGTSPDDYGDIPLNVSKFVAKNTLDKVDTLDSWKRTSTNVVYSIVGVKKSKIRKYSFDFLSSGNINNEEVIKSFALSFDSYFDDKKK